MCLHRNACLFSSFVSEIFQRPLKASWILHSKRWLIGQLVCLSVLLWRVLCGCRCKFFHREHFEVIHNKQPQRHAFTVVFGQVIEKAGSKDRIDGDRKWMDGWVVEQKSWEFGGCAAVLFNSTPQLVALICKLLGSVASRSIFLRRKERPMPDLVRSLHG